MTCSAQCAGNQITKKSADSKLQFNQKHTLCPQPELEFWHVAAKNLLSEGLSNKLRQIARQCESETFSCLSQRAKGIIWVCPAPTCGAYLWIFTDALRFLWAWFRMFLLFCLMNLINYRPDNDLRWAMQHPGKKSFFISALNTTDGGGCIDTEFVFHDFTGLVCLLPHGRYIFRCHSFAQGSAGRCCLYTNL